jgi:hypothetical protein
MSEVRISLDKSKTYSEQHGDCTPEDPFVHVKYWQGQLIGKDMVLLPFDANGELVPDDGKASPFMGTVDGKPVQFMPLYSPAMRALVERKKKRGAAIAIKPAGEEDEDEEDLASRSDEVNFVAWLKGEVDYHWNLLQMAGKRRYSTMWFNKKQMVTDLVMDHELLHESEISPLMAKYLPARHSAPADQMAMS